MRRTATSNVYRWLIGCAAAALVSSFAGVAQAQLTWSLSPDDLADAAGFAGGAPFGWDWDVDAPLGSSQAGPTGFGNSSWFSDVQGSTAGGGRDYTAFRLSPAAMFGLGAGVTIGDLDYISYFTKNMDLGLIDWQLKVYTESTTGNSWFGQRFNFHRPLNPDNDWHQSTTDGAMTVDWINDRDLLGPLNTYYAPGVHSLDDAKATYGSSKILFIDIIAGFATSSPPVASYLDGVSMGLEGGATATMDLTAVPEPSTALMLLGGLLGVACLRRRRQ